MSTVSEFMRNDKGVAYSNVAKFIGSLVYFGGMLIYTAFHNYNLMLLGLSSDQLVWALVGVLALELSAIGLPIAIKHWAFGAMHRGFAIGFYVIDLTILTLNVIASFQLSRALTDGSSLSWVSAYLAYIVPATPVIIGIGWSLMSLLDPANIRRAKANVRRAAVEDALEEQQALLVLGKSTDTKVKKAARKGAREETDWLVELGREKEQADLSPSPNGESVVPLKK